MLGGNMDLRILRHVVVLARQLSYTKAAEELGLSQSALSRSIQSIEQRTNYTKVLRRAGEIAGKGEVVDGVGYNPEFFFGYALQQTDHSQAKRVNLSLAIDRSGPVSFNILARGIRLTE